MADEHRADEHPARGAAAGTGGRARRRPTMADVASGAGVSRALVSLVFRDQPGASPATRDRVLRVAEQLGYRPDTPARLLARGRSRTIGVMFSVRQPFQAELVEGIYPEADRLGYEVLLSANTDERGETVAIDALLGHRCEALILLGCTADTRRLDQLGRHGAVVVIGRRVPGATVDSVHTAEAKGVRAAVEHLTDLGHRRIAHIDGGAGPGSADRRRAYRAAMRRHRLTGYIQVIPGDHTERSGVDAGHALLAAGTLPTAVLAANDRCAIGLLDTLDRAGIQVPRDISVVGYDDSHLSHLSHINLTTVRQDVASLATHAVRCAVARLTTATPDPHEVVVDPKLVIRGTTAPPPAGPNPSP